MTPSDQCNHCAEAIRWLTTAAGKRMPVNAAPDPERGNIIILGGHAGVLGPRPATAARYAGKVLYLHHAVTCPYASRWQDKTGRARQRRPTR